MATESDLHLYVASSGRDWSGLCQALAWNFCNQFGSAPRTYASALDAYYASSLVSTNAWSVEPGGFVYFAGGAYGHVDVRVDNQHEGMASGHVSEFWGINAGEVDLTEYIARTGMEPLGWSRTNGVNDFVFEPAGKPPPEDDQEDEMPLRQMHYTDDAGKIIRALWSETGYFSKWSSQSGDIPNAMAKSWATNASVEVSVALFDRIEADCRRVSDGGAPG